MSQILDELEEIVYVSSLEDYELLYLNKAGLNAIGLKKVKPGSKCYKVIQGKDSPCDFCPNAKLSLNKSYNYTKHNSHTNKDYYIKDKLIHWEDGKIRKFEIAVDITEAMKNQNEIEQTEKTEATIIRCIKILHNTSSLSDNLYSLLNEIGKYLGSDTAYIFKIDKKKGIVQNTHSWISKTITHKKPVFPDYHIDELPNWFKKLEKQEYIFVNNINDIPKNTPEHVLFKSLPIEKVFIAPLIDENQELYGYIGVDNPSSDISEKHTDMLFKTLNYFIISTILKDQFNDKLAYNSFHDLLTTLQNRNKYVHDLKIMEKSRQHNVGIAFIDMNGLKHLNDTEGHDKGDEALIQIAKNLLAIFNPENIYRIGGDEFVVVITNTSKIEFMRGITKIQAFSAKHNTPSVAIGYDFFEQVTNFTPPLKKVDTLMYADKERYYHKNTETHSLEDC